MENLVEILVNGVNPVIEFSNSFLSTIPEGGWLSIVGSGVTMAFSVVAVPGGGSSSITDAILASVRRWHGGIDDQFGNVDNAVILLTEHQTAWQVPSDLLTLLTGNRDGLQKLINKCRTTSASSADRAQRNTLLKSTVGMCLLRVKIWAYGEYMSGVMTADDVHRLGFLLPGETGGHRGRTEATDVKAESKVIIINEDFIRVVIDQSSGENAAQVAHGWPTGVKQALIVITAADGRTEVYRQMTTRLHNDIRMPEGSHGKQFILKVAFLRHVDDEPRFGNEQTFSMPLTTADLAATIDRQHHEEFEAHVREVELHRQEVERLQTGQNTEKQ
jgi:hypothetical protein